MAILNAYTNGLRRVCRAPAVWLGAWLLTLALGLPLALVLRSAIAEHLGASLAADAAAERVNWDWWQEFQQQASGIGATFDASVIGFASVLRHISDLLDNAEMALALAGAVAAWLVVWSFLSGGILDRYARNRATWASGFFAACGTHFFRFARLGIVALLVYAALFAWVHPLLDAMVWTRMTRNLAEERTAFGIALGIYAVFGALLVLASLVFDYARVRIVVEDRRSALAAILASLRFLRRHPARVLGLYVLNGLVFVALAALYALVAPGAGSTGPSLWIGLAVGQAWILTRLWAKLTFYASEVSLFQHALAHADYVATAVPEWPESPAAEALRAEPPTATVP
jgi:hypothetical protein